ncbi:hypothetical protein IC582_018318 [Cucumis melo]
MIEDGGSKSLRCSAFPSNRCISDANTSSKAYRFNKTIWRCRRSCPIRSHKRRQIATKTPLLRTGWR